MNRNLRLLVDMVLCPHLTLALILAVIGYWCRNAAIWLAKLED